MRRGRAKPIDSEVPFNAKLRRRRVPKELAVAPPLDETIGRTPPRAKYALLINPFYPKDPHASFGKHVLTPTLALTSIASATPSAWDVRYWDENLLNGPPPYDPMPQVVGISVHLTFAKRAYELARWYRQRGTTVVLGGLHVMSCPDEAARYADALALGDGVQLWPLILKDVEEGSTRKVYRAEFSQPFDKAPTPRRELLPHDSFLTTTSIEATRGCHNRCRFCYLSTNDLRIPYQMKAASRVAREIEEYDQPYAVFTDDNLGSNKRYLYELCYALQPIGKIWSAAVSVDVTDDPKLVRAMALAGCTGVFVGFESLTDANLQDARKKTPPASDYARRVAIFHENGIHVNASFVLGFDHDRRDVFAKTAEWVEENRLDCATFHILTPYPGTPFFREMDAEGRLLHKNWALYDTAHVVFRPKNMTPDELFQGYAWLYQRLFSHTSIWRRRPRDWRSALPYLAMSYLYKRSNAIWHFLIRHNLTRKIWAPLVELTRVRHLKFRQRLATLPVYGEEASTPPTRKLRGSTVVPAGL
jgi:radical SAM superfamily enzyme YgiQ (UPF0313 family)